MKLWMRKIAVALVAVVTFGLYIPEINIDVDAEQSKETADADTSGKNGAAEHGRQPVLDRDSSEIQAEIPAADPLLALSEKAQEQTFMKMGPRITAKVEDEFQTVILPKVEEALHLIMDDTDKDDFQYFSITERPSDGFGERIFNIYDERTGKDIARFDVRRENRPMEGYWFNFHYHLSRDGFEEHHDIGEIYWDKNIPPKWMA